VIDIGTVMHVIKLAQVLEDLFVVQEINNAAKPDAIKEL